eukprot:Hpha_TRINITY_DN27395_c0_g1::TRINITY_DN27395_c0_g1_i1::g.548::m.548
MMRGVRLPVRLLLRARAAAAPQRRFGADLSKLDPYETFEGSVEADDSVDHIKEAYRDLVKKYHPDSNPDADPSKIAEINHAYQMLIRDKMKNPAGGGGAAVVGDEPPVPRSSLQERVYRPAEARWEEQTQMQLHKVRRRYGGFAYGITWVLFHIVQFVRMYRFLVAIMMMGMGFQLFRGWLAQRDLKKIQRMRAQHQLENSGQSYATA